MTPIAFREARHRLRLSQADLGRMVGVSERQIRNYETGTRRPPPPVLIILNRLLREAEHIHDFRCYCGAIIETTSTRG